jgi:hypothetical protein
VPRVDWRGISSESPTQINPDEAGEGRPRRSGLSFALATIFSGIGGVVLAILVGPEIVPVQTVTKTVRAPPIIQYRYQTIGEARPCSGTRIASGPPYEPNEYVSEAYGPLKARLPYAASLTDSDDVDFYAFCVKESATVAVRIEQIACNDCSLYSEVSVTLLNNNGSEVASETFDSDQTVLTLTNRLPRGRYFIRLAEGSLGFRYQLSVEPRDATLSSSLPAG